jgi:glycosyltransferase involved in cell wall biosynthesis
MPSTSGFKRKIVFMIPYPLGYVPGQRFRFEQYVELLAADDFTASFFPFLDIATLEILYKPGRSVRKMVGVMGGFFRRISSLRHAASADFVFIYREAAPIGPPLFEWFLARILKKKIIYDFDDAIWLPATSSENRIAALLKWPGKMRSICRWSYKISSGNQYLYEYAHGFNSRVVLNPTTIDTVNLHNPEIHQKPSVSQGTITIGWTGTHSTLQYLTMLEPVLAELEKKHAALRVLIIADKAPQLNLTSLEFRPWSKESEIEDLLRFDIGVMPLADDAWAKGKCGFKALQYMALNIVALASPVGVNTEIISNGKNGFLCKTESEWKESLEKVISDPALRLRVGSAGRQTVNDRYSVGSNKSTFLSLFD